MNPVITTSLAISALALLSACNSAALFSQSGSRQFDRLESAMASCAIAQGESQKQLREQGDKFAAQSKKIDDLSTLLASSIAEKKPRPAESEQLPEAAVSCIPDDSASAKLLVGRREQVWLEDVQLSLPARVDTGAETASLDGRNIELFERNGKRWVRFDILHPQSGEPVRLEKRLKRTVSIVQSNSSEAERRPVIKLGIAIGPIKQSAEFTLSNRSHLDYQMLIGRNILKDVMIVDVSKTNVVSLVSDEQEN